MTRLLGNNKEGRDLRMSYIKDLFMHKSKLPTKRQMGEVSFIKDTMHPSYVLRA
jgi:hypothetical protein